MDKNIALRTLQFLDSATVRGNEVPDFMICVNSLRGIAFASDVMKTSMIEQPQQPAQQQVVQPPPAPGE